MGTDTVDLGNLSGTSRQELSNRPDISRVQVVRPPASASDSLMVALDGYSLAWPFEVPSGHWTPHGTALPQQGDVGLAIIDPVTGDAWLTGYVRAWTDPTIALVSALPSAPSDGQVIDYLADATNGVVWRLRYRAASASTRKWEFVGGSAIMAGPSGSVTTASGTAVALTGGPTSTLPLAGDYEIGLYGSSVIPSPGGSVTNQSWTLLLGGAAGGSSAFLDMGNGNTFAGGSIALVQRVVNQASGTVVSVGVVSSNGTTSVTFGPAQLVIRPVRVG